MTTITRSQSMRAEVLRAMERHPDVSAAALARHLRGELGDEKLIGFAVEQIERVVSRERRRAVRAIETRSQAGSTNDNEKWGIVEQLLEEYRREVIVDWTTELLNSEFALGDGTTTTWAAATVDQHLARIGLLERNVRGNLDAIQRHEAAIATITNNDVTSLSEVGIA